ncbi:hypothetical protein FOA52_003325 [Chlamydomonas sp. UWO 241]|nr:hypothetical protein FOA52_003325 [Chlamydomonas sp. UWO 241]
MGKCTHTSGISADAFPFWWIDLEENYVVTSIVILGRKEYTNRLDGIKFFVGSEDPDTFVKSPTSAITSTPTTTLLVEDVDPKWIASGTKEYTAGCDNNKFNVVNSGCYVTIQGKVDRVLTLCDVKIFGYRSV